MVSHARVSQPGKMHLEWEPPKHSLHERCITQQGVYPPAIAESPGVSQWLDSNGLQDATIL